jgi:hypothetical protein
MARNRLIFGLFRDDIIVEFTNVAWDDRQPQKLCRKLLQGHHGLFCRFRQELLNRLEN